MTDCQYKTVPFFEPHARFRNAVLCDALSHRFRIEDSLVTVCSKQHTPHTLVVILITLEN
jgi:hypothetical protein